MCAVMMTFTKVFLPQVTSNYIYDALSCSNYLTKKKMASSIQKMNQIGKDR